MSDIHESSVEMVPWCLEKAAAVVESLALAVEMIRADPGAKTLWPEIRPALWNATKVLASFARKSWKTEDVEEICSKGVKGYEEVAVRYGIRDKTTDQANAELLTAFTLEYETLLQGPRSPNRTKIHELLSRQTLKHTAIDRLADLVEEVTQGRLSWEDLRMHATPLLEQLKALSAHHPKGS